MSKSNAMLAPQALADVSLTRDDMGFIAKLVYEQAGIVIREHKEAMTRGRLARRVKALGLNSVAEYCAYLKTPQAADEIPELINAVTTNHTSFFRERHHFDHLRKDVLPRLLQERGGASRPHPDLVLGLVLGRGALQHRRGRRATCWARAATSTSRSWRPTSTPTS